MAEDEYHKVGIRMPISLVRQVDALATREVRDRSGQVIVLLKEALAARAEAASLPENEPTETEDEP